ncbi:hypothetical protein [Helicobacter cappadocius]|uniref:DUF1104 domain-containing protein n=1 Tax=Helicobacter cappadocius TaxID=3063998 RepID=A0AA90T527_9HELI|nr:MULTISPECIES: hypothetical protein [unclassified Helicobacter]MDO7253023.1 hypothetical protein [Helicobacter sp. faydin-H75]MDP2538988.1 hypothetical protein [Helicobacter sp. faydin-H76]
MKKYFVCLFLLFATVCVADNWRDLNELHKDLKNVGLDDVQEKAVKKLFKQYHHQLKDWWKANGQTDALIMRFFSQEGFNIEEIKNKLNNIHHKKIKLDLDFLQELHSILNEEQRCKISKEFGEDD